MLQEKKLDQTKTDAIKNLDKGMTHLTQVGIIVRFLLANLNIRTKMRYRKDLIVSDTFDKCWI